MRGTLGNGQPLTIYDLGTVGYRDALDLQHRLVSLRQQNRISDTLLLLEHTPVITQGRSAVAGDIIAPADVLERSGVAVVTIERGGETTYHGPGQLVGYPIIDLRGYLRSLKKYIHLLEEVFVEYLDTHHGVEASRDPDHRGVWVGNEKITAVGVAVQQRVTFHGFAFNVNTDLSHFDWIIPCGITDRGQTSVQALTGERTDMSSVKRGVATAFCELFGYDEPPFSSAADLPRGE
jgi:lipoyl(octanoyl) transferase